MVSYTKYLVCTSSILVYRLLWILRYCCNERRCSAVGCCTTHNAVPKLLWSHSSQLYAPADSTHNLWPVFAQPVPKYVVWSWLHQGAAGGCAVCCMPRPRKHVASEPANSHLWAPFGCKMFYAVHKDCVLCEGLSSSGPIGGLIFFLRTHFFFLRWYSSARSLGPC